MITTADWLRYVDALGPSDANAMRSRLQSAGADPMRAQWLVSIVWKRQVARAVARIAIIVVFVGFGWLAWQWWRTLHGDPGGPSILDMVYPAVLMTLGGLALVIASAIEVSPELDLLPFRQIPSELSPAPRQISVAPARRGAAARLVIGIICLLSLPLAFAAPETRNRKLLHDRGVEVTGRITSLYTTRGSKGGTRYHVGYSFDRGTGSNSISRSRYKQYHVGDAIQVTYLPDQPEVSDAHRRNDVQWIDDPLWIVLAYIAIGFPVIMLIARIGASRQRALAENGMAAVAEITHVGPQSVTYRFGENTGRFFWGKRRLRERPSVGQPLVILYDPQKPRRSIPLGALSDVEFG